MIGLGSEFAVGAFGGGGQRYGVAEMRREDAAVALTALCKVGTETDLPALMQRLQSPIQSLDKDPESRTCIIC